MMTNRDKKEGDPDVKAKRKVPMGKVPGEVPAIGWMRCRMRRPPSRSLEKKSLAELRDLLARQKKIEGDKRLCKKLPDGGGTVVKRWKHPEELACLLTGLSINGEKYR